MVPYHVWKEKMFRFFADIDFKCKLVLLSFEEKKSYFLGISLNNLN